MVVGLEDDFSIRKSISTDAQGNIRFSVWVSFAEIYNEQIYDLLEPISSKAAASATAATKRKVLTIRDDRNGNPYIKGNRAAAPLLYIRKIY